MRPNSDLQEFFFVLEHFQSTKILQEYYIGNVTWLVSCHILAVLMLIVSTDETESITNEVWFEIICPYDLNDLHQMNLHPRHILSIFLFWKQVGMLFSFLESNV